MAFIVLKKKQIRQNLVINRKQGSNPYLIGVKMKVLLSKQKGETRKY